jgi:hypothetical protein
MKLNDGARNIHDLHAVITDVYREANVERLPLFDIILIGLIFHNYVIGDRF